MFENAEWGQVGIGTLIVFFAMVLVAAIAAGVLINTAGFLQSKSQETGEQSTKQVSNRLQKVVTTGNVATVNGESKIDRVNVTVTLASGAGEIDLNNATVSWVGPDGTYQLTRNGTYSSDADTDASADSETFDTSVIKDAGGSAPVLNDPDDRLQLVFVLNDGSDGDGRFADALEEGEEVTIKINTLSGADTTIRFTVPESLGQKDAVEL